MYVEATQCGCFVVVICLVTHKIKKRRKLQKTIDAQQKYVVCLTTLLLDGYFHFLQYLGFFYRRSKTDEFYYTRVNYVIHVVEFHKFFLAED